MRLLFTNEQDVKSIEEVQLNRLRKITNQIITMIKMMSVPIDHIPEMVVNYFSRYSFDDLAFEFVQEIIYSCECWFEQSPNDSNFYIHITQNYDKIKNDKNFIDFRNKEVSERIELFKNIPIQFAKKLNSKIYELHLDGLTSKEISEKLQNKFIPDTLEEIIKKLALSESSKIFINFTKFKYEQPLKNICKDIENIEIQDIISNFSIEKLSEIEKEIKENISKLEEIEIEFEKAKESIVKYKILDNSSFFEDELKELEYISKKAVNFLYKISKEKEKIQSLVKDVGEIDPNPPYGKHGINGQYVKKTEAEQKKIEEKIKEKKEQKEENRIETGALKKVDLENMLYSDLTKEEQETVKQRTLKRIEKFKDFWSKGNLQETVVKFVPQAIKMPTNGNGKDIYRGNSDIQVIFDINGNYFRIQNIKIMDRRSYLDLQGNIITNEKVERKNGKIVESGVNPSRYQLLTHFSCDIDKNNMLQKDMKANEKEISNPKWFIVVPLNEQGIEDCDFDRDTDNVKQFVFDRNDEYYAILGIGFKVWKQNIFIDEYETTCIEPKDFSIIREAIKTYDYSKDVPHFLEAMELAEKCNTYLELWL